MPKQDLRRPGELLREDGPVPLEGHLRRDAQGAGIATIFQELDLAPGLDVTANLFLGRELTSGGFLSFAAMRREAATVFSVDTRASPVGPPSKMSI